MKRAAGRQLTKDDDPEAEEHTNVTGDFQKAAPEVLAKRRILKGRRSLGFTPRPQKPNPFAALADKPHPGKPGTAADQTPVIHKSQNAKENAPGEQSEKANVAANEPSPTREEQSKQESTPKSPLVDTDADADARNPLTSTKAQTEVEVGDIRPPEKTEAAAERSSATEKDGREERRKAEKGPETNQTVAGHPPVVEKDEPDKEASGTSPLLGTETAAGTSPAVGEDDKGKNNTEVIGSEKVSAKFGSGSRPHLTFDFLSNSAPDASKFAEMAKEAKPVEDGGSKEASSKDAFKQPEKIITGEEDDDMLFKTRARLYGLAKSEKGARWKEEGLGVLKINRNRKSKKSRFVMRATGTLRLLLNAPIWKELKVDRASDKSARMVVSEHTDRSSRSILLRLPKEKDLDEFIAAVEAAKDD